MRLELPPDELVEVLHAVFERRLIRPAFVESLLHERAAAGGHARNDFSVFDSGLPVCRLFGFDEFTLEKRDIFGIVELDYVRTRFRSARNQITYDERMRIPLDHHIRKVGEPDCALSGIGTFSVAQDLFVPALIDGAAGPRKPALHSASLHAVPIAEFPFE